MTDKLRPFILCRGREIQKIAGKDPVFISAAYWGRDLDENRLHLSQVENKTPAKAPLTCPLPSFAEKEWLQNSLSLRASLGERGTWSLRCGFFAQHPSNKEKNPGPDLGPWVSEDFSQLLVAFPKSQGVAVLTAEAASNLVIRGGRAFTEALGPKVGVIFLALPWFKTVSPLENANVLGELTEYSSAFWADLSRWLLDLSQSSAYLVVSAVGRYQDSHDKPMWFDGPLGVLRPLRSDPKKAKTEGTHCWLCYVPPGGEAQVQCLLPPESWLAQDPQGGVGPYEHQQSFMPSDVEDQKWAAYFTVHRVLLAWQREILRSFFGNKMDPAPALSGESNIWVHLGEDGGEKTTSTLKKAMSLVHLCQIFQRSIPIVIVRWSEAESPPFWKRFLGYLGAHTFIEKDYLEEFSQRNTSYPIARPEDVFPLELFEEIWTPVPGFPWDQRKFVLLWREYLNHRTAVLEPF